MKQVKAADPKSSGWEIKFMYMAKLGMKPSKETVQEWKKCYEILKQDAKIMNSCFKLLVTADSDLTKIDFK